jgi:hypothetical protein
MGIDRTIPAVNSYEQLLAGSISINANLVPASMDLFRRPFR